MSRRHRMPTCEPFSGH